MTIFSYEIYFLILKTAKLEFFVDFKGGKCYKVMNVRKSSNANNNSVIGINSKDSNNNVNSKASKEKEKEKAEIIDMVGNSKSAFVVSCCFFLLSFKKSQLLFKTL